MLSTPQWIAVGTGAALGAAFIGYCIYFDQKRRSDPDFRKKLKERRSRVRQQRQDQDRRRTNPLPNFNDPSQMQAYFLQEVQLGEELLAEGDYENAVEHLSNAVTLCGQPQQLLQILQQSLPPQVFQLLVQRLPATGMRLARAARDAGVGGGGAEEAAMAAALAGEPRLISEDAELE